MLHAENLIPGRLKSSQATSRCLVTILGDCSQYGGPLYTLPDHDLGEWPWYAHDDLWRFKLGADEKARFDNMLEYIHDLSLTAEVARVTERRENAYYTVMTNVSK